MWNDPIIEEIHQIRQEHAAKFDYDIYAIVQEYQKRQKLCGKKIISFAKNSKNGVSAKSSVKKKFAGEARA